VHVQVVSNGQKKIGDHMQNVGISKSHALKDFKKMIGQTNHFLITILVALDGITNGKVKEKNSGFSTCWNPKDKNISADRSRLFATKATLAWCVDALDAYFMMTNRSPKLIQDPELEREMTKAGQSVYCRMLAFTTSLQDPPAEVELVKLAITWRNRLVHHFGLNAFDGEDRRKLISNKDYFRNNYRNLDVENMLANFDKGMKAVPTFKEVTSIIAGTIRFVTTIDAILISTLDYKIYGQQVIAAYIGSDNRKERIDSIWSKTNELKIRKLNNILREYGLY